MNAWGAGTAVVVGALCAFCGCTGSTGGRVQSSTLDDNCVPLDLPAAVDQELTGAFVCDEGVCTGIGDHVGFSFDAPELFVWINFERTIVGNYSEEALRDAYRWMWYRVEVPQLEGNPATSDSIDFEDVSELERFAFQDGELSLAWRGHITEMTRFVPPAGRLCFDGDPERRLCGCKYPVDIPVTLSVRGLLEQ